MRGDRLPAGLWHPHPTWDHQWSLRAMRDLYNEQVVWLTHEDCVRLLTCLEGGRGKRLSNSVDSTTSKVVGLEFEVEIGRSSSHGFQDAHGLVYHFRPYGRQRPMLAAMLGWSKGRLRYRFRHREGRRCGSLRSPGVRIGDEVESVGLRTI